ncbi:MAG: TonB-dependent receptor [Niabella sp.]
MQHFHLENKICRLLPVMMLAAFLLPLYTSGQGPQITVTGKVTKNNGDPLPLASVLIKGTNKGTTTDEKGVFTITVAPPAALVVSAVGYDPQEILVSSKTESVSIILNATGTTLEDVVIIGYGEQKRKDLTGAVSSLKADDIKNIPQAGIDQMLQGRVAGVSVTQNSGAPGGGVSVKIRGISSLGSNEPLYVIDGVPVDGNSNNDVLSIAGDGETKMSALASLNASDILSVDILKDASATAIYGNKAANGVVIITTKKGKIGKSKINLDSYVGMSDNSKYLELMNLKEYAAYKNDIADFRGDDRQSQYADISLLGYGTDWQREIFTRGVQQNHQLALSGGTKGVNYYISGNYYDQEGTIIGSGLKRKSVRLNLETDVTQWLKMGINATYSSNNQKVTLTNNANNSYGNVIAMAILQAPDVPVYNVVDGTFGGPDETQANGGFGNIGAGNPVAQAKTWHTTNDKSRFLNNLYAQMAFGKHLNLRSDFGSDLNWNKAQTFVPTYTWGSVTNTLNTMNVQTNNAAYWNWRSVLTYKNKIEKNDITFMLGREVSQNKYDVITSSRSRFLTNNPTSLSEGDPATASSTESKGYNAQESYFGRLIYAFDNKYSFTGTLRRDRSSNFAPGKQVGYFPAAAVAWTISEEKFLKKNPFLNYLKLRIGYGEVGNQNISQYAWGTYMNQVFINQTAFGSGAGYVQGNYANPDLTWEHQQSTNIGIDASLAKRFDLTLELYNKISDKFLFPDPSPYIIGTGVTNQGSASGIASRYVNLGKMQNRGFDLTLKYHTVGKKDFSWNSALIFSRYKNTVKELTTSISAIYRSIATNGSQTITYTTVGQPVGLFYGLKTVGIIRTLDQLYSVPIKNGNSIDAKSGTYLGDIQFEDINGDGVIDENDRTIIGDPNPDFTFGFSNNFTYKNFDLTIFANGVYGNDLYNYTRVWGEGMTAASGNQMKSVKYRWTPENPNTNMPRYANGDPNGNATQVSDRFIEDGSYLRIQNVQLAYTIFPNGKIVPKFISKLKTYIAVQNVYTFTHYSGYDPEVGSMNYDIFRTGIDMGRYPVPRTLTFGINAEF